MIELDIVERLRGKVRVPVNDGAGLLDGKDFFERTFPTSKAAMEAADEIESLRAQLATARKALITVAAECHRAKWQFDLSEDYRPTAAAARDLIGKSFDELHRIGDLATAANDTLKSPPPEKPGEQVETGPVTVNEYEDSKKLEKQL